MHPSELKIEDFTYELPSDNIARYPLKNRSDSKLLVYKKGRITDRGFKDIVDQIPEDSILVYNNTKVFFARFEFVKSTGARIEVFCLEPDNSDVNIAMQAQNKVTWKCMVGNAKKWKGETLSLPIVGGKVTADLKGKLRNDFLVEFTWDSNSNFAQLSEEIGNVPLPPYLQRKAEESDKERYQTVYSKKDGSVAAPTAGLHFTDSVLSSLRKKGITELPITLHVGAGTFQPVKSETMSGHDMHSEEFTISTEQIRTLRDHIKNKKPIVVVGTTSLRALESLFWINENEPLNQVCVTQWSPYEGNNAIAPLTKLNFLLAALTKNEQSEIHGKTSIIIAPGYSFKYVDALVTNFHQPKSTLLLLVAALVGKDWQKIYKYALSNNFRFLSYGDSSMLWKR